MLLGVHAYVLLLVVRGDMDSLSAKTLLDAAKPWSDARPDWPDYLRALADGDRQFMWHFWESMLWEERGGVITFDEYIALAFASLLASGSPVRASSGVPEDQRFQIERVVKAFDQLQVAPWPSVFPELPRFEAGRRAANDLLERLNRAATNNVVAIPLDADMIREFRTAAFSEWSIQRSIPPQVPAEMIQRERVSPEDDFVELGINTLVPKEFFARTEVFARPSDLGDQFVRALARGETEYWLTRTSEQAVHADAKDGVELRDAVRASIRQMRGMHLKPSVVVFKDWELLETLRDEPVDPFRGDVDEGQLDGVPITMSYESVSFDCIVADFRQLGILECITMMPRRSGDEVVDDGRLLVGVEPIDDALARELWQENPLLARFGDADDPPEDEAIYRLRQRVVVRVLENVNFKVKRSAAACIFTLASP